MKSTKLLALLMLTLALVAVSAQATPLAPGGNGVPVGETVPAGLTLLASSGQVNWMAPGAPGAGMASGTLESAVYKTTAGTLDFVYQYTNDPTSTAGISQTTGLSFAMGFCCNSVDADFFSNGSALGSGFVNGTAIPQLVARSAAPGIVVTWTYNFPTDATDINPGQTGAVLVIATDATAFQTGTLGLIAGGTFTDVNVFEPAPAGGVPEPAMFLPLGAGLMGFALFRRRRARA